MVEGGGVGEGGVEVVEAGEGEGDGGVEAVHGVDVEAGFAEWEGGGFESFVKIGVIFRYL